jgi:predicted RNA-binding protein with PIN domain
MARERKRPQILIDGHNLIGQTPGLSLADPDDEAQLVARLRVYAARTRAMITVVFDRGVFGHPVRLGAQDVRVSFARSPQDADAQLLRAIARIDDVRNWRVVTSDRAIVRAAGERGIAVVASARFAAQLFPAAAARAAAAPTPSDKPERRLSEAEIAEWLRVFGEDDPQPPA